jgi:hypothetical protein
MSLGLSRTFKSARAASAPKDDYISDPSQLDPFQLAFILNPQSEFLRRLLLNLDRQRQQLDHDKIEKNVKDDLEMILLQNALILAAAHQAIMDEIASLTETTSKNGLMFNVIAASRLSDLLNLADKILPDLARHQMRNPDLKTIVSNYLRPFELCSAFEDICQQQQRMQKSDLRFPFANYEAA